MFNFVYVWPPFYLLTSFCGPFFFPSMHSLFIQLWESEIFLSLYHYLIDTVNVKVWISSHIAPFQRQKCACHVRHSLRHSFLRQNPLYLLVNRFLNFAKKARGQGLYFRRRRHSQIKCLSSSPRVIHRVPYSSMILAVYGWSNQYLFESSLNWTLTATVTVTVWHTFRYTHTRVHWTGWHRQLLITNTNCR